MQTLLKYIDHDRFEKVVLSRVYNEKDLKNLAIVYEELVMQREACIGKNCTLYHQVTIESNEIHGNGVPTIGDDVVCWLWS